MKSIGILTLNFNNYGTKLQAYALSVILKKIVREEACVQVIKLEAFWGGIYKSLWYKKLLRNSFKNYGFLRAFRYIMEKLYWKKEMVALLKKDYSEQTAKRNSLFQKLNEMIPYTSQYYSFDDIRNGKLTDFDCYIVGSDQVWNALKVGNQDIFMLDFFKDGKRLSYAASFGMTKIPNEMFADYKRRIAHFDSLLIREQEGVDLCKSLGRDDAELVLDPTLLLKREEYAQIIEEEPLVKGKFILVYSLNQSYKIYNEAYRLSKKEGCKMIVLKRSICPPDIEKYDNALELYAVSPEGFLWLIRNAECVVTNSYHALIFSINFNTPYYLYLDNADEENSRMISISKLLGLNDLIFWETEHLPKTIMQIDFSNVNKRINEERNRCITLLTNALVRNGISKSQS